MPSTVLGTKQALRTPEGGSKERRKVGTEAGREGMRVRNSRAPWTLNLEVPPGSEGNPLQHSCLETPMGGGAWWANSRTRPSDFTFPFHFHALEKEMATHSSVLAWKLPGTGEPGELASMGLHRVGHD